MTAPTGTPPPGPGQAGDPTAVSAAETEDGNGAPRCPVCRRRLVILASRSHRDANGVQVRRQLWGCPGGHATATYANGSFGPIAILPEP